MENNFKALAINEFSKSCVHTTSIPQVKAKDFLELRTKYFDSYSVTKYFIEGHSKNCPNFPMELQSFSCKTIFFRIQKQFYQYLS